MHNSHCGHNGLVTLVRGTQVELTCVKVWSKRFGPHRIDCPPTNYVTSNFINVIFFKSYKIWKENKLDNKKNLLVWTFSHFKTKLHYWAYSQQCFIIPSHLFHFHPFYFTFLSVTEEVDLYHQYPPT